jgi:eukaryotic-like serine/threonine-protein kinase
MPLTAGTRFGAYEILVAIGAGGMGEVYKARDTKLGRDVAIKVLSSSLVSDPDRIARFEREAQVLASLNHPNIAHLYGFEEGPTAFLVMELVDGPTLAELISGHGQTAPAAASGGGAPRALSIEDTIAIARQIAEALEVAHDAGIVHRDLKPANIKVRDDGTVKVLDFGLAKAMAADSTSSSLENSPTLTARATQMGVILGTAAYMAPEQAKGKVVDRRADIWAFGVVVHEMLTGDRTFKGEDMSDTLAAVLRQEVQWSALPATTPPRLKRLLERCLDRDVKTRLRDIGEARIELAKIQAGTTAAGVAATGAAVAAPPRSRVMHWVLGALAGLALASFGGWTIVQWMPAPPAQLMRFSFVPSTTSPLSTSFSTPDRVLAISPDGKHLAYVTGDGALVVRAIDSLETEPIRGIAGARAPFFSPDGKWIGYFQGSAELRKVSVTGGPSILLCPISAPPRGASWGSDDVIVFATADANTGLATVPAGGGEPKVISKANPAKGEGDHLHPAVLPGGAILFTITPQGGQVENAQVAVLDQKTGAVKTLVRGGSQAEYVEPGYLVYGAAGSLRAVRLDVKRLEVTSDPVPVVEQVAMTAAAAAEFSISRTGTLVYLPGGLDSQSAVRTMAWIDRKGQEEAIKAEPRAYFGLRLSPDGTRLALDIRDQKSDIWVWHLARGTLTPLTFDPAIDSHPVWTPDSRRVVFASSRAGSQNLYWQAADGTGEPERLTTADHPQFSSSISPDGARLLLTDRGATDDLGLLSMDKRQYSALVQTSSAERNPEVSPDGKWVAYESAESTPAQVYVRPFPDVNGGKWQMSTMATGGGVKPVWAPNGRELFFVGGSGSDTALYAVPIPTTPANAGNPVKLFNVQNMPGQLNGRFYDVSRDGQRFVVIKSPAPTDASGSAAPQQLVVVVNWFGELKAKAGIK